MVYEPRKQSMAWMEHGLQMAIKRYAFSVEDKMAAETMWQSVYCAVSPIIHFTPTGILL